MSDQTITSLFEKLEGAGVSIQEACPLDDKTGGLGSNPYAEWCMKYPFTTLSSCGSTRPPSDLAISTRIRDLVASLSARSSKCARNSASDFEEYKVSDLAKSAKSDFEVNQRSIAAVLGISYGLKAERCSARCAYPSLKTSFLNDCLAVVAFSASFSAKCDVKLAPVATAQSRDFMWFASRFRFSTFAKFASRIVAAKAENERSALIAGQCSHLVRLAKLTHQSGGVSKLGKDVSHTDFSSPLLVGRVARSRRVGASSMARV